MTKKISLGKRVLNDQKAFDKAKKAGGGKIIPTTDDEKAMAADLEKCQSLEECWQLHERYVKPKSGLDHHRIQDVLEHSRWGKVWFWDNLIKYYEGLIKYVEKALEEGDFLHLNDSLNLSNKRDTKRWLKSAKAEFEQMTQVRDQELKRLAKPK